MCRWWRGLRYKKGPVRGFFGRILAFQLFFLEEDVFADDGVVLHELELIGGVEAAGVTLGDVVVASFAAVFLGGGADQFDENVAGVLFGCHVNNPILLNSYI